MIPVNLMIPQSLWSRKVRRSVLALFIISLVINVGMWLERFVIIVVSLQREFISVEVGHVLSHAVGLGHLRRHRSVCSLSLFYLFIRFLPMISMVEMRSLVHADRRKRRLHVQRMRPDLERIDATDFSSQRELHLAQSASIGAVLLHRRAGIRALRDRAVAVVHGPER